MRLIYFRKFVIFVFLFALLFPSVGFNKASAIDISCSPGGLIGGPPLASIPTYDYGLDGLLRFHFKMQSEWTIISNGYYGVEPYVSTNFFNSNCQPLGSVFGYSNFSFPNVPNLMLKAESIGNNSYNFKAYDEDTGLLVGFFAGISSVTAGQSIGFTFGYWPNSTAAYYGIGRVQVDTPVAPVIDPNFKAQKTPILIVPGVLGTDILKGTNLLWANPKMSRGFDGFMDPLAFKLDLTPLDSSLTLGAVIRQKPFFHYTDELINLFISQGYTEGKDLFTFPYDWRFGVSEDTVSQLKSSIDYILNQTDAGKAAGKVEVVAHSTGGLIVKRYVKEHPSDHHIDKAVFVGVPNLGAPKAFKALINGDSFDVPNLDPEEMKKISQNMPVVYDLAPSKEYVNQVGSFLKLQNPFALQTQADKNLDYNSSIQDLEIQQLINSQALTNSQNLHTTNFDNYDLRSNGVDLFSIVGCKQATFGQFYEIVQKFGPPIYDFPKNISGDGTVPFGSADSLVVDGTKTFFAPKIKHGDLLSADGTRQQIVNLLTQSTLDTKGKVLRHSEVKNKPELCQIKGDQIKVKSPVSINVTDQDGNFSGIAPDGSIQNDIPGADYEIWGEHKYLFLPTDEGQTYNIKLNGTGSGTFTLEDQGIDGDNATGEQIFSNLPVTTSLSGTLNLGVTDTLSLDTNGDGTIDQTLQPSSIINGDQSQDLIPPVSTYTLTGLMGQPGFYRSSVTVNLSATDPVIPGQESQTSGVLKTVYSLDGGATSTYASALSVTAEGAHSITFFSTDNAGNNEAPQTVQFIIDKTAPEFSVNFDPTSKDLVFSSTEGAPSCQTNQCTATDSAGNTTVLNFARQTLPLNIKNMVLKTISYNGQVMTFDANLLTIAYTLSGSTLTGLTQTELIKNQQILNIIYTLKQNQSVITDFTKGSKGQVTTATGLKVLLDSTNLGKIQTSVK